MTGTGSIYSQVRNRSCLTFDFFEGFALWSSVTAPIYSLVVVMLFCNPQR